MRFSLLCVLSGVESSTIIWIRLELRLSQWNAFVELLPLWLAPNMVTLIGFFFILANIGLLVLIMPDLVGPVRIRT
jgi:hypothetical protein